MEHKNSVIMIAEAGVNHNGDFCLAKEMAKAAKNAGADYIKFQTFVPQALAAAHAKKAAYQENGGEESQLEMLKKLALTKENFWELKTYCRQLGIGFLSTPFDMESIAFLSAFDMDYWKIPSGEITNLPYLEKIAETRKPVILSTGMSELEEIQAAVDVLERHGSREITLLHCTTEYPAPLSDVNLLAMRQLGDIFHKEIGYSDHTQGIEIPIAAAALGARVIEKHFTLDKSMEGPDHRASLEPAEWKQMATAIRNIELALGDGSKKCSDSERANRYAARKSIVASRDIKAGEIFTEDNITVKRPGNGISPMEWRQILGRQAAHDYCRDELIQKESQAYKNGFVLKV